MALIPAGEFEMGTDPSEVPQLVQWAKKWYSSAESIWFEDEAPRHTVYLDTFYMDRYEVTNALYKKFMDATGHKAPEYWDDHKFNASDHPVGKVTWDDAVAYTKWAEKRLPTEAEWEKAARGGLVGKKYPCGDSISHDDANYSGTGGKDIWEYTSPVGSFNPNSYGLYDMAGNVWEWCADWDDSGYYSRSPERNPTGPNDGIVRVVRGGSWYRYPIFLRVADRGRNNPPYSYSLSGFRCVSQD